MADGPALSLQAALVAALKADAGVAAIVGARVYDEPPQDVAFPYVRIGEILVRPFHTDGQEAFEITFGIEAFSRPVAGRVEAARLAYAVQAALHDQTLAITGYGNAWTFCETFTTARDGAGQGYSSIIAFTAMLDVA